MAISRIRGFAFEGCTGINRMVIPAGIREIEEGAFINVTNLYEVGADNDKFAIIKINPNDPQYAYEGGAILQKNTDEDGNDVLDEDGKQTYTLISFLSTTDVTSYTVPDNVTHIGNYAFAYNERLVEVNLNRVRSVGAYAFADCRLTYINMPAGLVYVGEHAFDGCPLEAIYFETGIGSGLNAVVDALAHYVGSTNEVEESGIVRFLGSVGFATATNALGEGKDSGSVENYKAELGRLNVADLQFVEYDWTGAYSYTEGDVTTLYTPSGLVYATVQGADITYNPVSLAEKERYTVLEETNVTPEGSATYSVGLKDSADNTFYLGSDDVLPGGISGGLGAQIFGENVIVYVYCPMENSSSNLLLWAMQNYVVAGEVTPVTYRQISAASTFSYEYINGNEVRIKGYNGTDTELVIPDTINGRPVTEILDLAFAGHDELVSVTVPSGVTRIGSRAFAECGNLSALYVEGIVSSLGTELFYGCDKDNLKVYGIVATSLEEYCNNNGISFNVGSYWGCFSLRLEVVGGEEGYWIEGMLNHNCNTSHKYVTIPSSIGGVPVVGIDDGAFAGQKLTSLTVSTEIAGFVIKAGAFSGVIGLTSVYLLDMGYESLIEAGAFDEQGSGVCFYTANNGVFKNASTRAALSRATLAAITESKYFAVKDVTGGVEIVRYYAEDVPEANRRSVRIPDQINGKNVVSVGNLAFNGATDVETVILGANVKTIGEHAFEGCTALTYIYLPDGLQTISKNAFTDCRNLVSLMIPKSVLEIGDYAFSGCTALMQLRITGTPSLGVGIVDGIRVNRRFVECYAGNTELTRYLRLQYSMVPAYIEELPLAEQWIECLTYEVALDEIDMSAYVIITGVKSHTGCTVGNHKHLMIPSYIGGLPVREIQDHAFAGNDVIESVKVVSVSMAKPQAGLTVGEGAFEGCSRLGLVSLGKVAQIGRYAFRNATVLATVSFTLTNNTVLGYSEDLLYAEDDVASVFMGCTNLSEVEITNNYAVPKYYSAGGGIYNGNHCLLYVYHVFDATFAPDSAVSIAPGAFDGVNGMVNLVLPDSITTLDASVLTDDYGVLPDTLRRIYLSGDVTVKNSALLEDLAVYAPVGATITLDSGSVSVISYIPAEMFDFALRVENPTDKTVYELDGVRYTYSKDADAWVSDLGSFSPVLDDMFDVRRYVVYQAMGETEYYQYAEGVLSAAGMEILPDMLADEVKYFLIHNLAGRETLLEVDTADGFVYYRGEMLPNKGLEDLFRRYSALVEKSEGGYEPAYVYTNGGALYTYNTVSRAFEPLAERALLQHSLRLLADRTEMGNTDLYYERARDGALVAIDGNLIYDAYQDMGLYLRTDERMLKVDVIDGAVLVDGKLQYVVEDGVSRPAAVADLYRSVVAHILGGVESVVEGYYRDLDDTLYYAPLEEPILVEENYVLYEKVLAYVGTTQGAVVQIADTNDSRWNGVEYRENVLLPDYAYICGISYPVVEVAAYGFASSKVQSIRLEGNIVRVGDHAFENAESLYLVSFGDSVLSLGGNLFAGCDSLERVEIGENVAEIAGNPFGDRVYVMEGDVIAASSRLDVVVATNNQSFAVPADSQMILSKDGSVLYAYYGVGGESGAVGTVVIPEGVSEIRAGAFRACYYEATGGSERAVTKVILPTTLRKVASGVFEDMPSLTTVIFTGEPKELGEQVFVGYNTAEFTVYGLEGGLVETYAGSHGLAFRAFVSGDTFAVKELDTKGNDLIPDEITIVGVNATEAMATMIIPAEINGLPVTRIDAAVFYGIDTIETLIIPASVTNIGRNAFAELGSLRRVIFLGTGGYLDNTSFAYNAALTEVHVLGVPTAGSLGENVFKGCNDNLVIYSFDAERAFGGQEVRDGRPITLVEVDYSSYINIVKLNDNEAVMTGYSNVTVLNDGLLLPAYIDGARLVEIESEGGSWSRLKQLVLPGGVRRIGDKSFAGSALAEIVIPSSVRTVGSQAFKVTGKSLAVYLNADLRLSIDSFVTATGGKVTFYAPKGVDVTYLTAEGKETTTSLAVFAASIGADLVEYSGADNFEYRVINGLEAEIVGLTDQGKQLVEIIVPRYLDGYRVTSLGDGAFAHNARLEHVDLPEDLTHIGNYVFVGTFGNLVIKEGESEVTFRGIAPNFMLKVVEEGNNSLRMITNFQADDVVNPDEYIYQVLATTTATTYSLSDQTVFIAEGAFAGATSIKNFGGVTTAGGYSLSPMSSVTVAGKYVYNALTKGNVLLAVLPTAVGDTSGVLAVPTGITEIGAYAFYCYNGQDVTALDLGGNLERIGEGAFEGASAISTYYINPESAVTAIPARAFYGNKALIEMPLINSLKSIGEAAFGNSGLLSLANLPDLLFTISEGAFADCVSLTDIVLPDGVTTIGDYAFRNCINLKSVVIPDEVMVIGEGAFAHTGLLSITLPATITQIPDRLLEGANVCGEVVALGTITAIGDYAFAGTALKEMPTDMMESVSTIGEGAFKGSALERIVIGNRVTEIATACFMDCKYLTDISLPSSIVTIGDYAFAGCNGLVGVQEDAEVVFNTTGVGTATVVLPDGSTEEHKLSTVRSNTTYLVVDGYEIHLVGGRLSVNNRIVSTTTEEHEDGTVTYVATVDHLTVRIKDKVLTVLGGRSLSVSWGVRSVQFGINVRTIGHSAFADCALTGVLISDGILSVGDYAFARNTRLEAAEIGSSLIELGQGVFSGAINLSIINVSSRNTTFTNMDDGVLYAREIKDGVYTGNVILKVYPAGLVPATTDGTYVLPKGTVSIDARAFEYSRLVTINIPDTVRSIGEGAFAGATHLTSVFFDGDLEFTAEQLASATGIFGGVEPIYYADAEGIYYATEEGYACIYTPDAEGAYALVDGRYVAYDETMGEVARYALTMPEGAIRYGRRNLVIDVPENSNLYEYLADRGYATLSMGADVTLCDAIGFVVAQHTAKACFTYTETEWITLTGLADCGADHATLVVPAYINGKPVKEIAAFAFAEAGIQHFVMGRYVENVGEGILYGNRIESVALAAIPNPAYAADSSEEPYLTNGSYRVLRGEGYSLLVGAVDGLEKVIVYPVTNEVAEFVLDESINHIGYGAFAYNEYLTNVVLHSGVSILPAYAFEGCIRLEGVQATDELRAGLYLPSSIVEIGEGAFMGAVALHSLYVGKGVHIAPKAFAGCIRLGEIAYVHAEEEGYKYEYDLDGYSFDAERGLLYARYDEGWELHTFLPTSSLLVDNRVILPETYAEAAVTAIGDYAFYGVPDSLRELVVPYNPTGAVRLGAYAFAENGLTHLYFEGNVYTDAAEVLRSGVEIYLPHKSGLVAHLNAGGFRYKEVSNRDDLSYRVEADGVYVTGVADVVSSTDVVVPYYIEGKPVVAIEEGFAGSTITSIELMNNIRALPENAFAGCTLLTQALLVDTSITAVPNGAFDGASALRYVSLPGTVQSIGARAFRNTSVEEVAIIRNVITSVGEEAFRGSHLHTIGASSGTTLTLWEGLQSVGAYAFADLVQGPVALDIAGSVTAIGAGAFEGNLRLEYVHFQRDVADLPYVEGVPVAIFTRMVGMQVKLPANAPLLKAYLLALGYVENVDMFLYTPAECFVYADYEEGLVLLGLHQDDLCDACKGDIYFPDKINGKPVLAVGGDFGETLSDSVSTVSFNSDLRVIEAEAFRGVSTLGNVVFGTLQQSQLVSIGAHAFEGTSITSLYVPSEVFERVGEYAFANVPLQSITFYTVHTVGDYAFAKVTTDEGGKLVSGEDSTLVSLNLSMTGGNIGAYAFAGKTNLASMQIVGSIHTIGEGAFLGSNLGNVRSSASLTDHVKVVANYAFMNTNIAYVPTGLTVVGDYAYARGAVAYNAENEPYSWPVGEVYRWTVVPDAQQTLTNVIIREVESVGKGAFAGTSLQSIVMGSKVEYLAATGYEGDVLVHGALDDLAELSTISVNSGIYQVADGALYHVEADVATLIKYPAKYVSPAGDRFKYEVDGKVEVPRIAAINPMMAGYVVIGVRAFVGSNVQVVSCGRAVATVSREAFADCTDLVYANLMFVSTVEEGAFRGCTGLQDCMGGADCIGNAYCKGVQKGNCKGYAAVTILASGELVIGKSAFEGTGISSLAGISAGSLVVGENAFYNSKIRTMILPENTISVGKNAFANEAGEMVRVQVDNLQNACNVDALAFGSNVTVYYVKAVGEYDSQVLGHAEAVANAVTGTNKVAYAHAGHFVVDENYVIVGLSAECANHGTSHSGETLVAPPYARNADGFVIRLTISASGEWGSCNVQSAL